MIRTLFRRGLRIGAVVGVILFLVQVFRRNPPPPKRTGTQGRTGPQATQRRSEPAAKTATPATRTPAPAKSASRARGSAKAPATPSPAARSTGKTAGQSASKTAGKTAGKTAAKTARARAGAKTAGKRTAQTAAWVEPTAGVCPTTHPVKVKLASGIFHLPGALAYARTVPDRCYRDQAAAEADGFRHSKR